MKFRLPTSLEGGLGIFAILLGITIIQLYIVRKANLASIWSIFKAKSPAEFACLGVGGKWYPNADSNDPCCMLPKGAKVDTDNVPVCMGELPFP